MTNGNTSPSPEPYELYRQVGFELSEPLPTRLAKATLRLVFRTPAGLRERTLFRSHRINLLLQKALQRCLGGPRLVRIRFVEGPAVGQVFECLSSEKYFLQGAQYERPVCDLVTRMVSPGSITYDIGAHIGYWVLCVSNLCGPGGHVFAFEPSKMNHERLLRNLQLNKISNATPVTFAASDMETKVAFLEGGSMSRFSFNEHASGVRHTDVQTVRLDDFVYRDNHPAPNLAMIDVEGFAGNVLRGAKRILRDACPTILCEVHSATEHGEVLEALRDCFYEISPIERTTKLPRHILARCEVLPKIRTGP